MAPHLHAKPGPVLDTVGQRLRPTWLAAYLENPRRVHSGTTMPDVLGGLPEAERQARVETMGSLLRATGDFVDKAPDRFADAKADAGAKLFAQSGCATCHLARGTDNAELLPERLPLVDLAAKWSPRALDEFLKDPFAVRPAGRMPAPTLSDRDRRHVVAYLLEQADDDAAAASATEGSPEPSAETSDQLLAAGRMHFAASGCANCHQLTVGKDSQPIASTLAAGPLATLRPQAGCLAESPSPGLPRYDLDAVQRNALLAAISWLQSAAAAAPGPRAVDRPGC
jgi:Cytochrome c2